MNNKILMIVNAFPPSGESGVQRPVKFLKYLARDGWETFVVTPRKAVLQRNMDKTLENDIPKSAKIYKTGNLAIGDDRLGEIRYQYTDSPSYIRRMLWKPLKYLNDAIFPIDKQIGWFPFALLKSIQLIHKYKIKNLYITASPFSAFLCGVVLKMIYGSRLFWVADYRDAWQFAPCLDKLVLPFRKKIIEKMDKLFLKKADYITFTSPYVLKIYQSKYLWIERKSAFITNGYDEDDFEGLEPQKFYKFTFCYMGKLHLLRGNPVTWLKVINGYMGIEFQFLHVGIINQSFKQHIVQEGLSFYKHLGYKSHQEALSYSAGADINVLVLNDDKESEGVVPGKIFELLRLGKPILAIGPSKSFIKEIIDSTGAGVYAVMNDSKSLNQALEKLVSQNFKVSIKKDLLEQYSRKTCTEKLEAIYLSNQNQVL
jgi:glycosyltransferase involved in cell wall biosynthesis